MSRRHLREPKPNKLSGRNDVAGPVLLVEPVTPGLNPLGPEGRGWVGDVLGLGPIGLVMGPELADGYEQAKELGLGFDQPLEAVLRDCFGDLTRVGCPEGVEVEARFLGFSPRSPLFLILILILI